jgi:hypothetical protein
MAKKEPNSLVITYNTPLAQMYHKQGIRATALSNLNLLHTVPHPTKIFFDECVPSVDLLSRELFTLPPEVEIFIFKTLSLSEQFYLIRLFDAEKSFENRTKLIELSQQIQNLSRSLNACITDHRF